MAQGFGDNSWVGIGAESTFGTAVARTDFYEFLSESIKLDQGREARSSLRGRSRNRRGQKKHDVSGTLELQMQANGMEALLKYAFGQDTITGPSGSIYTHTFALTRALPIGLSLEVNRDSSNIGGTSSFLYDGCQVNKLTFKHEPGDFLKATADIVGEGDASLVAVSTPTFATFIGFDWTGFTAYYDTANTFAQTNALTIKSLDELVLDNNLATDRYNLGSNKRKGFGPNGNRMISGKFTVEFDSLTVYNLWKNQSNASLQFSWDGNLGKTFNIYIANVEFVAGPPNISEAGPITLQIAFEAYLGAAEGDECYATLLNTTASVI